MSKTFVDLMTFEGTKTYTENMAIAVNDTGSDLLNLFSIAGALRGQPRERIEHLFELALAEDLLLATKLSFYTRDVRGGLGERDTARIMWKVLASRHPLVMKKNLHLIPEYGRWDDLYSLIDTDICNDVWELIRRQFYNDFSILIHQAGKEYKPISLLAKWLHSPNATSKASRKLGKLTAKKLGISEKRYRKILSSMREYLNVVEKKMCANEWEKIEYPLVPSLAMKRYRNAFLRHDGERFKDYLKDVADGREKINASTLYPYDIIEEYGVVQSEGKNFTTLKDYDKTLEALWKALPNYVEGNHNILVMPDTSGSMWGRPLNTALGLGIYFAERNHGVFKDVILTFSSKPSFVKLKGDTLRSKIQCIPAIVSNTNIQAAFELILQVAKENKLTNEDIPKTLVIISDMEFDAARGYDSDWLFYDKMKRMYAESGYKIPNIVFWNVASRHNVFHALHEYEGVQMFSGHSASTFKSVINSIGTTPYEAMLKVLNSERYSLVTI